MRLQRFNCPKAVLASQMAGVASQRFPAGLAVFVLRARVISDSRALAVRAVVPVSPVFPDPSYLDRRWWVAERRTSRLN